MRQAEPLGHKPLLLPLSCMEHYANRSTAARLSRLTAAVLGMRLGFNSVGRPPEVDKGGGRRGAARTPVMGPARAVCREKTC